MPLFCFYKQWLDPDPALPQRLLVRVSLLVSLDPLHNGSGQSYVEINHCPWCGAKLPESERDRYFGQLKAHGIDPVADTLPIEFCSDAWWSASDHV